MASPSKSRILIIDDEPGQVELLTAVLERSGRFTTLSTTDSTRALALAEAEEPDGIICDIVMPGKSGLDVTRELRARFPELPILVLTGKSGQVPAEAAYAAGATDFLGKPVQPGSLLARLTRALEDVPARKLLREATERRYDPGGIIGTHPRIQAVHRFVEQVAAVPGVPALLLGESGTGKNLVARAIHAASRGARYKFVEVNCAALPENLLEAEIFGYEKGAFTDAKKAKKGLAEVADGGTLLLDEIGTLSLTLQAKLLTFLESRKFRRVGGTEDIEVNLRILAATNADLESEVEAGRFREDLFYRLNVAQVVLPPLREIRSDIGLLAEHLVVRAAEYFGKPVPHLDQISITRLEAHHWPGNVRELRNVLERALIFSRGETLRVDPFIAAPPPPSPPPEAASPAPASPEEGAGGITLGLTLAEVEKRYIQATLEATGGDVQEAADRLGVTRKVLWSRRKKHGLL